MSARDYALYSVCPQFSYPSLAVDEHEVDESTSKSVALELGAGRCNCHLGLDGNYYFAPTQYSTRRIKSVEPHYGSF